VGGIPRKEEKVQRESTLTNAFFCPKNGGRLMSPFPFGLQIRFFSYSTEKPPELPVTPAAFHSSPPQLT
jgi:hypothetical protein